MSGQSRTASLAESVANTGSGFVVSLLTWQFIVRPLFHIHMGIGDSLSVVMIFTFVSITRTYLWRRWFNKLMMKKMRGNA